MLDDGFYTGTHMVNWLSQAHVKLFVSHRRLMKYSRLPRAVSPWALDSGGFSEYSLYGRWMTSPVDYVTAVRRYDLEIGRLEWAAPQDSMCEAVMLDKAREADAALTGRAPLSRDEQLLLHQQRTVQNFLDVTEIWEGITDDESPFMPVLQGHAVQEYLRCVDLYARAGVDLTHYELVGIGSVCRRQATDEIGEVLQAIRDYVDPELPMHGFGVKKQGLRRYGHMLTTADSLAWSFDARRAAPLPGCTHKNCANCLEYMLRWRNDLVLAA